MKLKAPWYKFLNHDCLMILLYTVEWKHFILSDICLFEKNVILVLVLVYFWPFQSCIIYHQEKSFELLDLVLVSASSIHWRSTFLLSLCSPTYDCFFELESLIITGSNLYLDSIRSILNNVINSRFFIDLQELIRTSWTSP